MANENVLAVIDAQDKYGNPALLIVTKCLAQEDNDWVNMTYFIVDQNCKPRKRSEYEDEQLLWDRLIIAHMDRIYQELLATARLKTTIH